VDVPAGADRLDVAIGGPSDLGADLDLSVSLHGTVVGMSADGDAEEAVSIPHPVPGRYEVRVDGYAVPSGSTGYDYRDVYFAPSLGSLSVSATPVPLGIDASATIGATVTATGRPRAGRDLFGELTLVTAEGAIVGRAGVVIKEVT